MSNFTSSVLGQVEHPNNILKEYLLIFRGVHKFKAHILSWLDGWLVHKRSKGEPVDSWIYVVEGELTKTIGCCRDTVRRHLKQLCDWGILERRSYSRYCTDKIYAYSLNLEKLRDEYIAQTVGKITSTAIVCGKRSLVFSNLLLQLVLPKNENQTIDCMKADSRLSDIQQSTVENQATFIDTSIDSSKNKDTTTEQVDVSVEKKVEKSEVATEKEKLEVLPQSVALKKRRVDVHDRLLLKILAQYTDSAEHSVAAWIEWADKKKDVISAPTRSLTKAIKEKWIPEKIVCTKEINPMSVQERLLLKEMRQAGRVESVLEQPCKNGFVTVVNCGNGVVVPWWEVILDER